MNNELKVYKTEQQNLIITTDREDKDGCFGKLFYLNIYSLMKNAQSHQLNEEELEEYFIQQSSESLHEQFSELQKQNLHSSLTIQLLKFFVKRFFKIYCIQLIQLGSQLLMPLIIQYVLTYVSKVDKTTSDGVILICIIFAVRIVGILSQTHSKLMLILAGQDAMAIVSMQIMNKCLKLSTLSNTQRTVGEITNLIQVDAQKMVYASNNLLNISIIPIQTLITLIYIYREIGYTVFVGIIIIILTFIANHFLGKQLLLSQKAVLKSKDDRIKQTNEVFQQIKFIKINAYESIFQNKIEQLREAERICIKKRLDHFSFNVFFGWLTPQLILSLSFGVYVYMGNELTPSKVFPIISLLLMLASNLQILPISYNSLQEALLSLKRVSAFLQTDEIMNKCIQQLDYRDPNIAIKIEQGNFHWNRSQIQKETSPILKNISLAIQPGQFVSLIGDIGSGKSSLIQALIGEMVYNEGDQQPYIQTYGNIAYVGQKAWIQNGSVKENILFGKEFHQTSYDNAVYYSCLNQDLEILIDGDATTIGEKGINLSGGQKARISLARAIYSDASIYLLDDPLSAVDIHVGNFIMKECFLKYLKEKTRLLSTHALSFCQYTDKVYLLQNGEIIDSGEYQYMKYNQKFLEIEQKFRDKAEELIENDNQKEQTKNDISNMNTSSATKKQKEFKDPEDLILKEDRQSGDIDISVYQKYFLYNGGYKNYMLLFIVMVMWIIAQLFSTLWIAHWSDDLYNQDYSPKTYMIVYFCVGIFQAILAYGRAASIANSSVKSTTIIHNQIIKSLLKAPQCEFFERVPTGRIMNRLTKDINSLDIEINMNLSFASTKISQIVSSIIIGLIATTKLIIMPLILFFYISIKIQRIYMKASREMQRLELISKSPILSYFVESLQGLSTIRAFQKSFLFLNNFSQKLDRNRQIIFVSTHASCWFNQILGFLSLIVNMFAIIYCILFSSNASFAGLILTYVSSLDINTQQTIDSLGLLENNLISFERCLDFTKVPQEKQNQNDPPRNWPSSGKIEFKELSVRYRPNLPFALKEFSYTINENEKIGVVGRTGAGKSTIALSLIRMLEAYEGQILIDGIDISQISLEKLRTFITSIQQDAVIFHGTIRQNLDPIGQCHDEDIKKVLNDCCLEKFLNERNGLDTMINESGDNLSAGEKQLICIARAILKKAKIILIDEATANIDLETEEKIQKAIAIAFRDCTVIAIAHRINTILKCDKILVIDNGQIIESGLTKELLNNKSSIFYNMYQEVMNGQQLIIQF
ncbi:unnamed protein product [Paramecium octaurelia]|uniref:ABC transporter family protein n=1 Tax=Paramecium octaurelia TaxID=43137 RepID=A0A8S1WKF8_PAROT|nr:unnamed protein product [Paramecium octaurelia]